MRQKIKLNTSPENLSLLSERCRALRRRMTKAEIHIDLLLRQWGIRYISQKGFFTAGGHIIVDFYLPKPRKVVIELDGPIHDYQKGYDRRRDDYLTNVRGFRVIRITNKHALGLDAHGLLALMQPKGSS